MSRSHRSAAGIGFLGIVAGLLGATGAWAQAPEPVVTLDEAVEAALRHSPQVVQAIGAVRNAESAERNAWGAFLPNLSLSSGASLSSTERFNPQTNTSVTGSSDSYSAGVSSQLQIFTGGRRGAELDGARAQTLAANAALVEQRYALILTTKRAFFDVLRTDDLIRVAEARVQRAQEGLDAATHREQVGTGTRSDVLRARLEVTNARQSLLQARNQRRTAAFALGRLVGVDGAVGARLDAPLDPTPLELDSDELLELVLENAPAVRAAVAPSRTRGAARWLITKPCAVFMREGRARRRRRRGRDRRPAVGGRAAVHPAHDVRRHACTLSYAHCFTHIVLRTLFYAHCLARIVLRCSRCLRCVSSTCRCESFLPKTAGRGRRRSHRRGQRFAGSPPPSSGGAARTASPASSTAGAT